jgi:hypothetical protein
MFYPRVLSSQGQHFALLLSLLTLITLATNEGAKLFIPRLSFIVQYK